MNQHDIADRQVIPAQFICFTIAGLSGLLGDLLLNRTATPVAFKFADAIFITGCILVAITRSPQRVGFARYGLYRSFHHVGRILSG